ncbi:T-cell antigen CD7 isoform X1 [Vulpes vulpes]|uniref:T-cell antigen CD7 isoform X1 n=1 Tax=Vulpes vulpes TaxID=9627 RepID=A0ABM4ZG90_VULVU
MLTLTFPLLALPLLWTTLPATSLSVQSGDWDNPSCTKGVVSVSRGERAVMACNISNDFRGVVIYLGDHRKGQTLFRVRRPGYFRTAGWQLHVQGGSAQLVIDHANDTQAGCYTWHLYGRQRNARVTMLNVSEAEPQDLKETGHLFASLREVWQSPHYMVAPEGSSVNITCSASGVLLGVCLRRSWPEPTNVIYYEDEKEPTVDEQFRGRIAFSGLQRNLTVTVRGLRLSDNGVYVCQAVTMDAEVQGSGTLLVVTDEAAGTYQETRLVSAVCPVLAISFFLVGLGTGAVCALRTQVKKLCCRKDKSSVSVVYEDMSYSCGNRMPTPNEYQ